jgi:glycosyltransferase involved in cell wall biosynthesis
MFIQQTQWARHVVALMGPDGPATKAWAKNGAEIHVLGTGSSRIREYMLLARAVKLIQPGAVIVWTPSRLGIKVAACRAAGARRITVHVGNPIRLSIWNRMAAEAYTSIPRARRATLIPVSRHVAQSFAAEYGFRHFPSKVIYNAISIDQFPWCPQDCLPEALRVGMVARLDSIKDHVTLLHAWKLVLRERPDWKLELAGDGPLRASLEDLARRLGINPSVSFLGWARDVPTVLLNWSIVVHSTTAEEGLGNSMLEAMAIGRPLVATDVGPVREVTDGGRVARLNKLRDPEDLSRQILDVDRNWAHTQQQVAVAREWVVQQFSPQKMIAGYLRCLGLEGQQ